MFEEWFNELRRSLNHQSVLIDRGEDPVFFVVYQPKLSLEMYRLLPDWQARLRHDGWTPRTYNLGMELEHFITNHQDYEIIVDHLRENPDALRDARQSLSDLLRTPDDRTIVETWVAGQIEQTSKLENGVLMITGVELLHPYIQIGRIEQSLQGRITCPVVVLYPGTRTSSFGLKYLGFYPADGNYRSRHIGGSLR